MQSTFAVRIGCGKGAAGSGAHYGGGCGDELTVARVTAGEWHNIETENLDSYLKKLGVAWAKRKVACSFKPKAMWSLSQDSILQAVMPNPLGVRTEKFPLHEYIDTIEGDTFRVSNRWEARGLSAPMATALLLNAQWKIDVAPPCACRLPYT